MLNVILSLIIALILALLTYPAYIKRMVKLQYGQQIREDGPKVHAGKAGTPTMGGVIFLLAAAVTIIIFTGSSPAAWLILLVMLVCGAIGFIDDYRKIVSKQSLGLRARSKLVGQLLIAAVFALLLYLLGYYDPLIVLPFLDLTINLGFFYPVFLFLVVVAATNAVNLTDGVDGLAAGITIIVLVAFLYIGFTNEQSVVMLVCAALIGATAGFLVFNRHPARLFMGDVGSLGLGGALSALAVITKSELFLIIIGGIYVVETLSVIAQVASFQLTGKRVFLMAPLHHHFELKGWTEWKVVLVFWGTAAIFALMGVLIYL
jgi:phospho-N-acetylmuramoyl-pentapeptide-transferase